jgi:site-specific DNA-methyltransferase (adenine-specific)
MEILDRLQSRFPEHYRHGNILMIHGDCMDVMKHIHDKEVELSCVDPPYGIGEDSDKISEYNSKPCESWTSRKPKKYDKKEWDDKPPSQEYFNELIRVSKKQIIWGGNYFTDKLPVSGGWIVWDKMVVMPTFSDGELAWCSDGNSLKFARFLWAGYRKCEETERFHPTQKPVALYKWLISRYAKHGELILDTHGGSGSIVIACHDLGHPIIWVEKDADYYRDAVARYKTHASQAVLFEPVEIIKEQKLFEEKQ